VSWICPTSLGSEHPGPSSPAQGAEYTAQVLDALTANPSVWASTVLLIMFDENDGYFDHVPPPAAPSLMDWSGSPEKSRQAGASSVDVSQEYHLKKCGEADDTDVFLYRPYGLGPRVPMYAVSPWSTGGWVNSEVADHTSVIRFMERRFGVQEPNISTWRRAVCGDLTGLFDFSSSPDNELKVLPATAAEAKRARALKHTTTPSPPVSQATLVQPAFARPSRRLPYRLTVSADAETDGVRFGFENQGDAAAVLHVYDQHDLTALPRRYTLGARARLDDLLALHDGHAYGYFILGPNGFHRLVAGSTRECLIEAKLIEVPHENLVRIVVINRGVETRMLLAAATPYGAPMRDEVLRAGATTEWRYSTAASGGWYDVDLSMPGPFAFRRRFAGRMENGRDSISDPAMGGAALIPVSNRAV
jgi:phospholipase C